MAREIERVEAVGGELVELRVGVFAPARFRLLRGLPVVTDGRVVGVEDPSLTADFVAEPGGGIRLVRVLVEEREGRPIGAAYVKRTNLERKARDEIGALLMSDPREAVPVPGDPDFAERLRARRVRRLTTVEGVQEPKRKKGPSPDDLRRAAEIHREDTSGAPLQAVAEALGISVPTASRWIRAAKDEGLEIGSRGSRRAADGPTADLLAVAAAVQHAEAHRLPIGETVRLRLPKDEQGRPPSPSTVWRKVREARRLGLLPPQETKKMTATKTKGKTK